MFNVLICRVSLLFAERKYFKLVYSFSIILGLCYVLTLPARQPTWKTKTLSFIMISFWTKKCYHFAERTYFKLVSDIMYQLRIVVVRMETGRFPPPPVQTVKELSEVTPGVAVYTVSSVVSIRNWRWLGWCIVNRKVSVVFFLVDLNGRTFYLRFCDLLN